MQCQSSPPLCIRESVATVAKHPDAVSLSGRDFAAVSRALADPRRFQILRRIAADSCSPCSDLRAAFPITAATLSHHLKELEAAGLVETTRRGKFVDVTFRRAVWDAYIRQLQSI
jgi:ArsR family transcriptional regulator